MRRSFCLLLCALVLALGMMAYSGCGTGEHVHTYAGTLASDELMHWYPSTCDVNDDCEDARAAVGYHEDKNNDGACDTCGYGRDHQHSFEAEWTVDAENHWHAVACGHAIDVNEKGAHIDENNDGTCDVCSYDYGHTHTYSTDKWTTDAENHWHAVTCGHAIDVLDLAAHTDADKDGACDICAYADAEHTHVATDAWVKDATSHWHTCTDHVGFVMDAEDHIGMEGDGVCDVCSYTDPTHTHTYATVWSIGETTHWHASSCGHPDLKQDEAAHKDENNDGACDTCSYTGGHVHTYAATWTVDAEGHWFASTCDHDVTVAYGKHTDKNNDGACDTCSYAGDHTHTYATEWSTDAEGHWFASTCDHTVVSGYAKHADKNNDGACDTCSYTGGHTHTYDTENWTADANGHWHAPTCGHTVSGIDYAAHTDANGDAKCDVCSYEDKTCEHASNVWYNDANGHWQFCDKHFGYKMNEGAHEYDEDGKCVCGLVQDLDSEIESITTGSVSGGTVTVNNGVNVFSYGKDLFHIMTVGGDAVWYEIINAGTEDEVYFGLKQSATGITSVTCTADLLKGYAFSLYDILGYGASGTVYGAEELITYLYEGAQTNKNEDAVFYTTEDGYGFRFGNCKGPYYDYAIVTVEFTLDSNGVVTAATVNSEIYTSFNYANGVATLKDGAKPFSSKTWVIKQIPGTPGAVNPYKYESLFATSFKLVDASGTVIENGGSYTTMLGKNPLLTFTELLPSTAAIAFDTMTYEVTDAEGNTVTNIQPYYYGSLASGFQLYTMSGALPGTYTVTLHIKKCDFTFTAIIERPELTSFKAQYGSDSYGYTYYYDVVEGTVYEITTAEGLPMKILTNSNADASFTYTVLSGDASAVYIKEGENGLFTLCASEAGTYTVQFTSAVKPEMTAVPVTVNVTKALTAAEAMPGGKYMYIDTYNGNTYIVTVTPDSEGATTGTIVYDVNGTVENYTYSVAADFTVTLTGADGAAALKGFTIKASTGTPAYSFSYEVDSYGYVYTTSSNLVDYDEDTIEMTKLVGSYYAEDNTHFRLSDGGSGNVGIGYSYGSYTGKHTYFKWTGEKDENGNWIIMLTVDSTYNSYYEYTGNIDTSYVNEEVAVTIVDGVLTLTKADGTTITFTKA